MIPQQPSGQPPGYLPQAGPPAAGVVPQMMNFVPAHPPLQAPPVVQPVPNPQVRNIFFFHFWLFLLEIFFFSFLASCTSCTSAAGPIPTVSNIRGRTELQFSGKIFMNICSCAIFFEKRHSTSPLSLLFRQPTMWEVALKINLKRQAL